MYPWNDSREPRVDVDPQDKELVAAARASWVRARERWLVTHRAIAAASGELQIQREKFQRRQQAEACSRTALDVLLPPHDAAPRDVRRRLALDDAAPSDVRSYHTSDWRTITTLGWCDSEDESKLLDVEEALAVEEEEEAAAAARTRSWVSSEPGASPPTSACTLVQLLHMHLRRDDALQRSMDVLLGRDDALARTAAGVRELAEETVVVTLGLGES